MTRTRQDGRAICRAAGRAIGVLATAAALSASAEAYPRAHPDHPAGETRPGLSERAGSRLPDDITVVDESGRTLRLIDLLDRPAVLSLVYYTCEHVCPLVLGAMGQLASDLPLKPGVDYRLITLSFDAADGAEAAAAARANYVKPLGPDFPAAGWPFLTASAADIAKLTDALGFSFEPDSHGFVHPAVLVVLGPGGRIGRYVHVSRTAYGVGYPVTFPPVALAEALRLAGAGVSAGRDAAPLLFCYPHEPPAQSRFYGLMTAMGVGTLVLMAGFFIYMTMLGRRPRPGAGGP